MFSANKCYRPQLVNVVLGNVLLFATTVIMSMGVFTVPIDHAAPSLKSVWSSGLGMANLFMAPAISLTGFVLDTRTLPLHMDEQHPVTRRVRRLALPISSLYFTLLLSLPAINFSSALLLRLSTLLLTVPLGMAYMLVIETLLAWLPSNPGLAMSFVSGGFGLSQFCLSPALSIAIALAGLRAALVLTAVFSFLATFVSLRYLSFPTEKDIAAIGLPASAPEANIELLSSSAATGSMSDNILTWGRLLRMPQFYLYIIASFTGRTAQSLFPYYFKLGDVFGLSASTVIFGFQALSLIGVFYAFAGNSLLERLSSPHRSAVRPLLTIVFFAQAALFALMVPVSNAVNGWAALLITSCLIIMLESQTAFGVILARDVFGNKNSALVFGVAGGLSFGVGASFFTGLLAFIEQSEGSKVSTPATFIMFWPLAACASLIGGLCVLSLRKKSRT